MNKPPFKLNGVAHSLQRQLAGREFNESPADAKARVFSWDVSPGDRELIMRITARVRDILTEYGADTQNFDDQGCIMDLVCVHANGYRLKLLQLLMASNDDITHDVLGIGVHWNRRVGVFEHGWKPRFLDAQ